MSNLTNHIVSFAGQSLLLSKFITFLEQVDRRSPNLLRILTYHRISNPQSQSELDPSLISATPESFEQQMRYLAANYHVISMMELRDRVVHKNEYTLPPRSVMITFDDAYHDFAEYAWPILQRYQLPVTLFVPTAFPDCPEQSFWWDRLFQAVFGATNWTELDTPVGHLPLAATGQRVQTYKKLKNYVKTLPHHTAMAWIDEICESLDSPPPNHSVLGWDALRQLAGEGVTMAPHTRTHPLMNRISFEEAQAEAIGSLHDLEREIGAILPVFAYPSGGVNDAVASLLAQEGFQLGFTTVRGINDLRKIDRLQLRRINVGIRTTPTILRGQLLSWSVYLNKIAKTY